jgi:hypothetical protein
MARPSIIFLKALVRFGRCSPSNLTQLQAWQVATLQEIATNKGGQMVSGSTNGSSFTQATSMTNSEWFEVLSEALEHIERGTMPQSRTIARLF